MIKTIKVKKKMRLDELIKYIFDNKIVDKKYSSDIKLKPYYDNKNSVYVHSNGTVSLGLGETNEITTEDTFTVEVEEEITKNTPFEWLVGVNSYNSLARYEAATITDVLGDDGADCFATKIYALIGNDLELIWEAE